MNDEKLRNALHAGHKLHWYQIEKVLGQGGFGITYLAYDPNLDQHVAIKEYLPMELAVREGDFSVYPASQAQDSRYKWGLDRFLTEARTLARFKHPSIVRVLSVFEENNTAYMVMEYQQGQSLQQILDRQRTLPEDQLVKMVIPLLDGLEVIHSQGFIHRDIKPSNLFIHTDGHPVLLDFGSARQALGEETRTLTSVVSPGYAPFEQYYSKSDRQGPWTDIYGLGATLYRCLTGLQPMAAIDRSEAILRSERDVFVSAAEIGAGEYSASFLHAVDCALFFNETKRPQSIAEWRPYFEFSTSTERAARDALHTHYPEDAPTRFSALVDRPEAVEHTAILNPQPRSDTSPSSKRSRPPGESARGSQPSGTPSGSRQSSARHSAPASEQQPPHRGHSMIEEAISRDTRPPSSVKTRRVVAVLTLLVALGAALGYAGYQGLLPALPFGSGQVERLVSQGDRALAAGKVFEPEKSSALAFYRQAYELSPGDVEAEHGLRLSAEQLAGAMTTALKNKDLARAQKLEAVLKTLPAAVSDFPELKAQLAEARVAAGANEKKAARVAEFIAAAEQDIERGKFVGNDTSNALARYRAVQILDPDNPAAAEGLQRLAVILAGLGSDVLAAGNIDKAAQWYSQASLIDADNAAVTTLGNAVNSARLAAADEQQQTQMKNDLLAAAEDDLANNRLSTPPGNNALERYRQLEQMDPGNRAAGQGIRKVHDRYIVLATQALTRGAFAEASQLAARATAIDVDSEPARALRTEIQTARERADAAESQRLAAQAEAQASAAAAARMAAEQARMAAEAERRRQAELEAQRLLAEAEKKAEAERQARLAEQQAADDAINGQPRMVVDFLGFHPKYARDGLTRDKIYQQVAPLITAAGYQIVTRGQVHDANYKWTNVKLLAYRLNINENTATGLYSYVGSVNLLVDATLRLSLAEALEARPEWSRAKNGMGPPSDMRKLAIAFVEMTEAFLAKRPGQRR